MGVGVLQEFGGEADFTGECISIEYCKERETEAIVQYEIKLLVGIVLL